MSILTSICKIFQFILKLFKAVVNAVAEAIKIIANAVVDVLDTIVTGVGDAIFGNFGSYLLVGGVLLGLYFLTKDSEEKDSDSEEKDSEGKVVQTVADQQLLRFIMGSE